ncbi:hypothetical protein HF669_10465 [Acidithiobacillus thiooxidans]|uniref:hypothetical protein n=1 Tax=Acidithiobacillus thiooxidans TaxID=930 RepID=UPI0002624DC3|nr:hypothetical protein [Acidithiobacillus thiooxidans]MBU2811775.1 hypothetical protein [Acidithiobacillus thiooxidans]
MMTSKNPIGIMCYNRPNYLKKTLDSILSNDIQDRLIFIFHDKPKNFYDEGYIETVVIIEEYLSRFPENTVYLSNNVNLGCANQWYRMFDIVFEFSNCHAAYFFEDDIVLEKNYLSIMDNLFHLFGNDERVGLISCFNPILRDDKYSYSLMGQDWGVGMPRTAWHKIKGLFFEYLKLQFTRDYTARHSEFIQQWITDLGLRWLDGHEGSDSIIEYLLAGNGLARIVTNFNLAMPIGEEGMHFKPDDFQKLFNNVTIQDFTLVEVRKPSDSEFDLCTEKNLVVDRDRFMFHMEHALQSEVSDFLKNKWNLNLNYFPFNDYYLEYSTSSPYVGKKNVLNDSIINSDGLFLGPYMRVMAGHYYVCIHTVGKANISCEVVSLNVKQIEIEKSIKVNSERESISFIFEFTLNQCAYDLEVLIRAEGQVDIRKVIVYGHMKG